MTRIATKRRCENLQKPTPHKDAWVYLKEYSIILLGFVIGVVCLYALYLVFDNPIAGLGFLGLFVLVGTLIGMNILSEDKKFTTGEVRKAIAFSFVSVFFGLLLVGDGIDKLNLRPTSIINIILDKYWVIITAIITFYFGGRAVEKKQE